ncbi:DUF3298 and DUF4163 domain-containing protein [Mucilaginibacter paludis]|uniref:DUF3298 domain-containing protein n=1 Tax=Mucilaginibacter paludis DSM 18603 TaxID=714943 RepID=H1YD19_9SPHI|nr:DUF3298 and DUF4163 domain-containing protein [Mucilaginibacter paludis]EHQ26076.1 hypothetical protein Mucpa_1929 [Mucilaginibacter paludis DSM 18603]
MLKTRLFIIAGLALLLGACFNNKSKINKPDITRDTLSYAYQNIKERAADCGNKPDTGCTIAKMTYPVFVSQNALNDTIEARLLNLFLPGNRPANDLLTQAKNFVADYDKFFLDKRNKKLPRIPFYSATYTKVLRQDSSLVTLQTGGYSFAGGAHGGTLAFFINWNTKAQKIITLGDIFRTGYKQPLTATAEKIFRKNENLKDTSSLARDYFFKNNQFALNDNFLITPVGIRFLFNQYEIKPYAAGTTDLFIPYSSISNLLKPNTVVSQYIK